MFDVRGERGFGEMNKKGLSEVVTTVLIILLVIAAIVIIWAFIQPAIRNAVGGVTGSCIEINLEPLKCENNFVGGVYTDSTVQVKRNADEVQILELIFVFEKDNGETVSNSTSTVMTALATQTYTFTAANLGLTEAPKKVGVASRITTEAGEIRACDYSRQAVCTDV